MLKRILFIFTLISTLALGNTINDYRNVLSEEEEIKLNVLAKEFEEKTGNKIFLNTIEDQDEFKTNEQEKVIIVNLVRTTNKIKIKTIISRDLESERFNSKIEGVLQTYKEDITKQTEAQILEKYTLGLLAIITIEEAEKGAFLELK